MKFRHQLLLWITGTVPFKKMAHFFDCVGDVASYRKQILQGIADLRLYQGDADSLEHISEELKDLFSDMQDTAEAYHTVLPADLLFDLLWNYQSDAHRIDGNPHQIIRDHVERRWYVGAREMYTKQYRGFKDLPVGATDIPLSEIFEYAERMLQRICTDIANHEYTGMEKYIK